MIETALGFSGPERVHVGVATINPEDIMNTTESIHRPLTKGDRVAYYITRNISMGHHSTRSEHVGRTGIVQGWRNGKVSVLHKAGYPENLDEARLYCVE
jgi:hypothetical protein